MTPDALCGARIGVTGATGFVGRRVVAALVRHGARVHAYGRRPFASSDYVTYSSWDIAAGPLVDAPLVDALVHCAGLVTDWGPRAAFHACHVDGTRRVLASFAEPCRIVHASTASVYDPRQPERPLREDTALPRLHLNAYCESKAAAERLVRVRSAHVILRPHAIYGPGDELLLPRLLEATLWGRQLAVGDGRNALSLTHVDNFVDAVLLALAALLRGSATGVFNVADEAPVPLDAILHAVLGAVGRRTKILYLPRTPAYGLGAVLEALYTLVGSQRGPRLTRYRVTQVASDFTLDLARARTLLGYRPSRSLLSFIADGGLRGP